MYDFLMVLPAILAVGAFIMYLLLKSRSDGDAVNLKIIEKLRQEEPDRFKDQEGLTSKQLFNLLQENNAIRSRISEQDFLLLKHSLNIDLAKSIIVYILIPILFAATLGAYVYHSNKPEPLIFSNVQLYSSDSVAKELAVDLDTLKLVWASAGKPQDVRIYLENTNTRQRSNELLVPSSSGSIEFSVSDYKKILSNRNYGEWNRIRAAFLMENGTKYSPEFKVFVGIKIIAVNFGEKVKVGAMIDNSVVQHYNFDAKLVIWRKDGSDALSLDGGISGGQRDFPIEQSYQYDWAGAKLVYFSPDDPRLIRTEIIYDAEELSDAEAVENSEGNYLGIWYSDYTDILEDGQSCNQKGTTQLFHNQKYAFAGLISCVGIVNDQSFEIIYHFRAGGIWSIHNGLLVMEIKDVNSMQVGASLAGVEIPSIPNHKASDEVTRHMPFSFEIIEKHEDRIVTRKHTLDGSYTKVEFTKRDKPYFPSST